MSDAVDDHGGVVGRVGSFRRVVSLVPSLTEAVEVSAPGLLVGATDYCTHPSTLDAARVGGSKYPDLAAVRDLRPDLVITNTEENRLADAEELRAAGVPVWVTDAPATVPAGLASTRRLLSGLGVSPTWLDEADASWSTVEPLWATAIIPVWRKPWVVVGRDTFAGDVLLRLGIANAYAADPERYPRPSIDDLNATTADLVVLPDEPYEFTADDGPNWFPHKRSALVIGRYLTWYGPSLVTARAELTAALAGPGTT
ncbi:ABC-type Fe3+-hydroxamate transport system substrate-binding protein [Actinokineospora baliensis]|uniref:helical backbone metal receptor n=1 Tax=Actinokineospora baliensis TaxID=547056 RepID=UPI0019566D77|nr:helical backbone metal receptor [Actinokineospora baliensis]MBM7772172.1 ABC-type Fe3+-hydroxamate transport system substrate-binding protein [Actinokineospora baliensis]